jgi:phage repressor protein C with HTH and peptisase S24 domain
MDNQQDINHQQILAWIDQTLKAKGWTERSWSMKATNQPDTIRNIRRGKSKAPRFETIAALANAAGVPTPGADKGPRQAPDVHGHDAPPLEVAPAQSIDLRAMPQNLPVVGSAACGPDGRFELQGDVLEYVRRPPRLMGVIDGYALYCHGSSMSPWREDGELVMVHPRRAINVLDYVVVQLKPEKEGDSTPPAYIKRLVKRTADHIVLHQFNPAGDIRIPLQKVLHMHRILPLSEMFGF